jgi:hypothetical protein
MGMKSKKKIKGLKVLVTSHRVQHYRKWTRGYITRDSVYHHIEKLNKMLSGPDRWVYIIRVHAFPWIDNGENYLYVQNNEGFLNCSENCFYERI